jgi:CP family cyanate transporter-like MFS transporter
MTKDWTLPLLVTAGLMAVLTMTSVFAGWNREIRAST